MVDIHKLHKQEFQSLPQVVASSPGKVNLMGEYTEFAEGSLLGMAVNRRVRVALEKRPDNSLRFYSADLNERKKTSLTNVKFKREDRWANYLKGVIFSLLQMGHSFSGMNITISGDIPHGIGLASSSAMELAFALALKELFQLNLNDVNLIEAVRLAEFQFMKLDSGISAPLIALKAKKDHLLYLDAKNLDYKFIPLNLNDYKLVITNTKVPNRVEPQDREDFRGEYKRCISKLKENHYKPILKELNSSDIGNTVDFLSESQRRYCLHFIEENQRVMDLLQFLNRKDMLRISKLLFRSHESMRDLLEISCPELDWIVKRVQETGSNDGARMIAPGYGGCTIALIHDNNRQAYQEILEEYDRIFGFKAEIFDCIPSEGAKIE